MMIFFLFVATVFVAAQEKEPDPASAVEEQMENLAETQDIETEDDSYLQQLQYYLRHPLNLNAATAPDLIEFKMLSDLQIQHFVVYRNLLGPFINIYELQAIPYWDVSTIRKIIPYVIISDSKTLSHRLKERLVSGDNSLMLRAILGDCI